MMQIAAAKRQIDRMIHKMQSTVGVDMTRSIVLSSLTREARRHHGLDGAQRLLQGLILLCRQQPSSLAHVSVQCGWLPA